jgi:hypothetical protein
MRASGIRHDAIAQRSKEVLPLLWRRATRRGGSFKSIAEFSDFSSQSAQLGYSLTTDKYKSTIADAHHAVTTQTGDPLALVEIGQRLELHRSLDLLLRHLVHV